MVLRCTEKAPWVYWSRILSTIAPPMGLVRSLPSAGPTKMSSLLMAAPFARLHTIGRVGSLGSSSRGGGIRTHTPFQDPDFKSGKPRPRTSSPVPVCGLGKRKPGFHGAERPGVSGCVLASIAATLLPLLPGADPIRSPVRRVFAFPSALAGPARAILVMVLLLPGAGRKHAATSGAF